MKGKKGLKIVLISLGILFLIVITVIGIFIARFILFDREKSSENMMEDYLANKYGEEMKIEIVHLEGSNTGNMGDVWHTVVLEDNRNIKFDVNMNGFFKKEVVDDEYEYGLIANEAYQKMKPFIEEIEKLGFSKQRDILDSDKETNYIEYEKTYSEEASEEILINMRVKYEDLRVDDILTDDFINGLHRIIEIIKTNHIEINHVRVDGASNDNLHINVKDVSNIRDKDDLITNLKSNNEDIVTYLEIDQYGTELKKLENERFIFENEYHDKWLECEVVDAGKCFNYSIHVLYKDDGLRTSNVHLQDDLLLMVFGIDDVLNKEHEEMSSNNYWKKYFAIYLRDESGYRYSVDNDGFSDEDLMWNVGRVIEHMSEER